MGVRWCWIVGDVLSIFCILVGVAAIVNGMGSSV